MAGPFRRRFPVVARAFGAQGGRAALAKARRPAVGRAPVLLAVLSGLGMAGAVAPDAHARGRSTANDFLLERVETDDGLPDNSVTGVVQTPDGFLWVGTFDGLARFDGVRFETFNPKNPAGLPSPEIVNLHLDRSGSLWCSTSDCLARLRDGKWKAFGADEGWTGDYARAFTEGPDGSVYISSFSGRVFQFVADRITQLARPPGAAQGGFVHCDPQGRLWLAQRGFFGWWDGARWRRVGTQPGGAAGRLGAAAARDGGMWIIDGDELRKYAGAELVFAARLSEPIEAIWSLYERPNGELWIASYEAGVFVVEPGPSGCHVTRLLVASGAPFRSVRCVFEGREGNVWVGTNGNGLIRLSPRTIRTVSAETEFNVKSICLDPAGRVWFATYGLGVFRVDTRTAGEPAVLPALADWRPYAESVLVDRHGQVWVGTFGLGAPSYQLSEGSPKKMTADGEAQAGRTALFEDSRGRVWMGGGAALTVADGDRLTRYPVTGVRFVAEDADDGDIWAASRLGLFRLSAENPGSVDQVERGTASGEVRSPAGGFVEVRRQTGSGYRDVLCIRPEPHGVVWLGTHGGGLVLRQPDGTERVIGRVQGLPGDTVSAIVEDHLGYWWLASNRGLVRVRRSELDEVLKGREPQLNPMRLTRLDGLPSDQCALGHQPAAVRTSDGRLWFATQGGVGIVDPVAMSINRRPPPVTITRVEYRDAQGEKRTHSRLGIESVRFPAGSQGITFTFAALSFTDPSRVMCRVRLERGGDLVWEHLGIERDSHFELLRPGDYRFRVAAANEHGVWNPIGATLPFRIEAYLWQTTGFRIGIAGALLLVIGAAVAHVLHHQRTKHRFALAERDRCLALERIQAAETLRQSESRYLRAEAEANLRRQREALVRDVHDGLGGFVANLSMTATMARSTTDLAELSGHLDALVTLSMETLIEVRGLMNSLDRREYDYTGLAAEFRQYANLMLGPHGIAWTVAERVTSDSPETDPRLYLGLYRVFKEAVANVVRHSGASRVQIEMTATPAEVRLDIEDNGRGLSPEAGSNRGLRNIERRLAELGGRLERSGPPGLRLSVTVPLPLPSGSPPPAACP